MSKRSSHPLDPSDYPPALTPQAMENQLVAMAYDAARRRFLDGSATAQEIVYFLKLGSPRAQMELANLEAQNSLLTAKKDALETNKNLESLYLDAAAAMSIYKGESTDGEDIY